MCRLYILGNNRTDKRAPQMEWRENFTYRSKVLETHQSECSRFINSTHNVCTYNISTNLFRWKQTTRITVVEGRSISLSHTEYVRCGFLLFFVIAGIYIITYSFCRTATAGSMFAIGISADELWVVKSAIQNMGLKYM